MNVNFFENNFRCKSKNLLLLFNSLSFTFKDDFMSFPEKSVVLPVIEEFADDISDIVLGGWRDWIKSDQVSVWRCKRSRANFVWEQMIGRAHAAFSDLHDVHIIEGNETFTFLLCDQVLFRFKKGDEQGLSSNIPTQQVLAYHDHDQDLFGLPAVSRVEVVYTTNKLETEIADILVVAREEGKVMWTSSLLKRKDNVIELPVSPTPLPPVARAKLLVQPKSDDSLDGQSSNE